MTAVAVASFRCDAATSPEGEDRSRRELRLGSGTRCIVGSLGLETELIASMRGPSAPTDMAAKHSPRRAQRIRSV